jgi:hypothetical protein
MDKVVPQLGALVRVQNKNIHELVKRMDGCTDEALLSALDEQLFQQTFLRDLVLELIEDILNDL